MTLSRYGIREWGVATLAALGASAVAVWIQCWWLFIPIAILWIAVAGFFRDPRGRRPATTDPRDLISPADGKISAIEHLESHEATDGEAAIVVRIFLSVLNVHINRTPCDGTVEKVTHRPGKYLDARSAESAKVNESNLVVLRCAEDEPIGIKQISGAIARRIVCPITIGQRLKRCERFGMIKFGSTTELIVRDREGVKTMVSVGDNVRGGIDVLVTLP